MGKSAKSADKSKAAEMAAAVRGEVDLLLIAMAHAQLQREAVDKIQQRVLAAGNYMTDSRWGPPERMLEPKNTYLLADDDAKRYYAAMDAEHAAAGHKLDPGYCPACIAEYDQTKCEWALIAAAEKFFPGVTNDKLLCGTKDKGGLETRRDYLDLIIKLVVNAPGYKSPLPLRKGK